MSRTESEKAAESVLKAAGHFNFNPHLFAGRLLDEQHPEIQRRVVNGFVVYLKIYRRTSKDPYLVHLTDPVAIAEIDTVDLTDLDQ
jgi:hypothetical protein